MFLQTINFIEIRSDYNEYIWNKIHSGRFRHAQILLGMRWCAMSIFLFLKFYNFIKGIMHIYIVFLKNLKRMFYTSLINLFKYL